MSDPMAWIVAAACFAFGALGGFVVTNSGWRSDCEKIGAHLTEGAVYKCEKQGASK